MLLSLHITPTVLHWGIVRCCCYDVIWSLLCADCWLDCIAVFAPIHLCDSELGPILHCAWYHICPQQHVLCLRENAWQQSVPHNVTDICRHMPICRAYTSGRIRALYGFVQSQWTTADNCAKSIQQSTLFGTCSLSAYCCSVAQSVLFHVQCEMSSTLLVDREDAPGCWGPWHLMAVVYCVQTVDLIALLIDQCVVYLCDSECKPISHSQGILRFTYLLTGVCGVWHQSWSCWNAVRAANNPASWCLWIVCRVYGIVYTGDVFVLKIIFYLSVCI